MPDNIQTLRNAGLIAADAVFSQADVDLINGLTAAEVQTLIAVRTKLGNDFLRRALVPGGDTGAPSIAIVF